MAEHTRHRLAFDYYVQMGATRSLEALHAALLDDPLLIGLTKAPTPSTLDAWSSTFHWQDRLHDLERQARARDDQDLVHSLKEMNQRHAKEGVALQQKGIARLSSLAPEEISASDAIRAVAEGVRLERLAQGVATEHVRQEGTHLYGQVDLDGFSDEELRRLAALAGERAAGAGAPQPP